MTENTNSPRRPNAKRPPALVIRLELEQPARVMIDADSFEDEQRLRLWLGRSPKMQRVLYDLGIAA